MSRIDFSAEVKRRVADRNGHRCSFPGCDRTTIGPASAEPEIVSTGVAAHIYSASPGGPRGQSDLPPNDLGELANALWLGANHSRIIDANRGTEFSPALLLSFKTAHEALIRFEQQGPNYAFGCVQSLTIEESSVFARGASLHFAKTTVINGANASGKTALCEWLAGCGEISLLKRWASRGIRRERTQIRFYAINPVPLTWTLRIFNEANIQFDLNGSAVPRLNIHQKFVYIAAPPCRRPNERISQYLARSFRIDPSTIHNVVRSLAAHGGYHVNNTQFAHVDEREELLVDVDGSIPGLGFRSLSSSEQKLVVLELGIELARLESERGPTMLLLDCFEGIDQAHFEDYIRFLTSRQCGFQVVITTIKGKINLRRISLEGHHIVTLNGNIPDVTISS